MKLYISVDMEGVWGLTSWKESGDKISKYMTNELNLVIKLVKKYAKDTTIVVSDSHAQGDNILVEALPEDITLIRGFPRTYYMLEGIDNNFDGCFFIGYHAPIGIFPGQMDHSYSASTFYEVTINGKVTGEAEINGLLAGYHHVPVLLISGDDVLSSFSSKNFPSTQFVITKKALSRYSAELIPYGQLVQRYESAIERALHSIGKVKPLEITPPFTIELELIDTSSAFLISQIPGTTLLSGRKVSYSSSNFVDIYKFLSVASNMGWINRNLLK